MYSIRGCFNHQGGSNYNSMCIIMSQHELLMNLDVMIYCGILFRLGLVHVYMYKIHCTCIEQLNPVGTLTIVYLIIDHACTTLDGSRKCSYSTYMYMYVQCASK